MSTIPPWLTAVVVFVSLAACVIASALLPSSNGANIAMAGCTIAGWVGLHSPTPKFLQGQEQLSAMVAMVCGGLAAKLALTVFQLHAGWPQGAMWGAVCLLCFVSGKPLSAGVVELPAPPPPDAKKLPTGRAAQDE